LTNNTPIIVSSHELKDQANFLQQQLLKTVNKTLSVGIQSSLPAITLALDPTISNNSVESYSLVVKPSGVQINAATANGVFYGITSLLQLIRTGEMSGQAINISCWNIKDEPRFTWRGFMLDESRHFFGKETVKELLDWMAFYKLNKFHWHLTDEPGWRIEIKSYPMLNLIGGIGNCTDKLHPSQSYTQEDIKEIVAYAKERYIEVIPEIDMPGHATAANKAYPEFSGGGSEKHPEYTFDPAKEGTYAYLSKILREVDVLFPSQMIHIGGDEVSFGNEKWATNEGVKQLMKQNKLKDLVGVEHYFTSRILDTLYKLNNKVLMWDQAAEWELPKDKIVLFYWQQNKPEYMKMALKKGYPVVVCPRLPFYFDFMQDDSQRAGRKNSNYLVSVDNLYSYNAASLANNSDELKCILGVQGNIWTEQIPIKNKLEFMLFPRFAALSETAWTNENNKDLLSFHERLKKQFLLYEKEDIYYYNPFNPKETPEPLTVKQNANPKLGNN
jgi:hexosaminidase